LDLVARLFPQYFGRKPQTVTNRGWLKRLRTSLDIDVMERREAVMSLWALSPLGALAYLMPSPEDQMPVLPPKPGNDAGMGSTTDLVLLLSADSASPERVPDFSVPPLRDDYTRAPAPPAEPLPGSQGVSGDDDAALFGEESGRKRLPRLAAPSDESHPKTGAGDGFSTAPRGHGEDDAASLSHGSIVPFTARDPLDFLPGGPLDHNRGQDPGKQPPPDSDSCMSATGGLRIDAVENIQVPTMVLAEFYDPCLPDGGRDGTVATIFWGDQTGATYGQIDPSGAVWVA